MTVAAKPEDYEALGDRLLAELCVSGDERAWRALHEQFYPIAVAFLHRLGVKNADIEDATQEVFLQVFRYLPRFRQEAELKTWLYQLCVTQARRTRRTHQVREILLRFMARTSPESMVSTPAFCERAAQQRIDAALATLSESERVVFVLYEMEGLAGKEIAKIVRCTETSVWRRLHYARRSFRRALGLEEEDGK